MGLERLLEQIRASRRELEAIEDQEDWFSSDSLEGLYEAEHFVMLMMEEPGREKLN